MASAHERKQPDSQFTEDLMPHLVNKRARLTLNATYTSYPISALNYDDMLLPSNEKLAKHSTG